MNTSPESAAPGAAGTPPATLPLTEIETTTTIIPVIEETARVVVHTIETGRVRVVKEVDEWLETLTTPLTETRVEVERVAVGRVVAEAPPVRQEGDVMVISVVREEAVVVTQLVLVEEVRIRRTTTVSEWQEQVPLRAETVHIKQGLPAAETDLKK